MAVVQGKMGRCCGGVEGQEGEHPVRLTFVFGSSVNRDPLRDPSTRSWQIRAGSMLLLLLRDRLFRPWLACAVFCTGQVTGSHSKDDNFLCVQGLFALYGYDRDFQQIYIIQMCCPWVNT